MAEIIPKSLFSVKKVSNQFVVVNEDDSGNAIQEGIREYYFSCLNDFEIALNRVNRSGHDRDLISQLLLTNTRLSLCVPNRRIEELELSLIPLRHQLAAHQFILGTETAEADELSQQAADDAPGKSWVSNVIILINELHVTYI